MEEQLIINANSYLNNISNDILILESNQNQEDFIKFFSRDEVFTIGVACKDKDKISLYFDELREYFFRDTKVFICNMDERVQRWNEIIYLSKIENSISNYLLEIIQNFIICKWFIVNQIGKKEFDYSGSYCFYEVSESNEVMVITNNDLLLKQENQRRTYVDKYVQYIKKITTSKQRRKTIPKNVKINLWNLHFDKEYYGVCCVCEGKIDINNFEAGHIISVKDGGSDNINNLKPICSKCNKSMGTMNMNEYKKSYYTK